VNFIKNFDEFLAKLEGTFIALLLSIMIILSFGQVILRNFFQEGILWGDIFLRQLVLWVGFLGAALAAREGRHITIDFLPNLLPQTWRRFIHVLVNLCTSLITGLLAWAASKFIQFEREAESVLMLDLPVWIFQIILPYSFWVISVRFLLKSLALCFPGRTASS